MSLPLATSGRRRITAAQRQATANLTGIFAPTNRGAVLATFKRAAPALGISLGLVFFIDQLMSYTIPADWNGDWPPLIWPSNIELAARLGIEVSRVKELIRAAIDRGLIIPWDHGTLKRWGRRAPEGRIIEAYGFNLSPLAERQPEFARIAAEYEAGIAEAKRLRREISRGRASTIALAEHAVAEGDTSQDWLDISSQAQAIAREARNLRDPLRLAEIAARLASLHALSKAALDAASPGEKQPKEPANRPHITTTHQLAIGKPITNEASQSIQGGRSSGGQSVLTSPAEGARSAVGSPLRGFPIAPHTILQIAPAFRDHVRTSQPSWSEISEAAFEVRRQLGISLHAYGQACVILGRKGAAAAVATIAAKHERGLVRSPGGYMRSITAAHQEGTLRLDRTLFGLLDEILPRVRKVRTMRQAADSD